MYSLRIVLTFDQKKIYVPVAKFEVSLALVLALAWLETDALPCEVSDLKKKYCYFCKTSTNWIM